MYHTPGGDRILLGAERSFFIQSLAMIVDMLADGNVGDSEKDVWTFLSECLAGCVLWDNDYESQASLDLPPDESRRFRTKLGIEDDYYTDVPPDPPDDQINLYLDALMGLTADVR